MLVLFSKDNFGIKINVISNLAGAHFDKEVKSMISNLTNAQFAVMTYLFDHKDEVITQNQLAAVMHSSHPTMRNVIKRMLDKDLINTKQSEDDKRKVEVQLSDNGLSIMNDKSSSIEKMLVDNQSFLTNGLSKTEVQDLNRMLDKVISNLKGSDY
ncbi:MarR family transcriptional regulator [Lactobacillus kunkeei]|nr:MarR family transcriptional regulator [Apilactobacillus kunkeei]